MPKTKITISIDEDLKQRLEEEARAQRRSLSNLIEVIVVGYFEYKTN